MRMPRASRFPLAVASSGRNVGKEKPTTTPTRRPFSTLQIGMGWFSEQDGGSNRYYCDLLRQLPGVGVEARGLVAGAPWVAHESGGQVEAFAPISAPLRSRLWGARRAVESALSEGDFPLVVSHFALYALPALDLIRPRPLVVHFHGPWASEGYVEKGRRSAAELKAALERIVYRRGALLLVLSRAFQDVLSRDYGVPPERIRVIPGAIDVDRFDTGVTRRAARERLGWPEDRPTVLAVRRLSRRMGLEDLIEAAAMVRRRVPEALVMVAGRGPLQETLAARARALGLENTVRFLGFVPDEDLPLAYRAADLTVVPTVALEGFGLIAAESLAAGTPVLVTPVGGLPEVVGDLSPELVLPGTGAGPLGEGLVAALTGSTALPGERDCRAYARARHGWPVIATRVREAYAEVIA